MDEGDLVRFETHGNKTLDLAENDTLWNDTFWNDTLWNGTLWNGTLWNGTLPYVTLPSSIFRHGPAVTSLWSILFGAVFLLGLVGNLCVMMVIARARNMHNATNFFIFNLALADLLVIVFCVPGNLLSNILNPWVLHLFMCKAANYMQQVSVNASVHTLLAISVERYLVICRDMAFQRITNKCGRVILTCIWIFSLAVNLPSAIYFGINDNQICMEMWPSEKLGKFYFIVAHLFMCYFIPLGIMTICYVRIWLKVVRRDVPGEKIPHNELIRKKYKLKWVKMILVVIAVFFLSWLPLYIFAIRVKMFDQVFFDGEIELLHHVRPLTQWLANSTSCVNPIIYAFFKRNFREGFRAIILKKSFFGPLKFDCDRRLHSQRRFRSTKMTHCNTSVRDRSLKSEPLNLAPTNPPKCDCCPDKDWYLSEVSGFLDEQASAFVSEPAGHEAMEAQRLHREEKAKRRWILRMNRHSIHRSNPDRLGADRVVADRVVVGRVVDNRVVVDRVRSQRKCDRACSENNQENHEPSRLRIDDSGAPVITDDPGAPVITDDPGAPGTNILTPNHCESPPKKVGAKRRKSRGIASRNSLSNSSKELYSDPGPTTAYVAQPFFLDLKHVDSTDANGWLKPGTEENLELIENNAVH